MKRIFVFLFIFFFATYITKPVSAHFVLNNNNVGVLIHIDPDDAPIAGQIAHIHLNFQDKTGELNSSNCNCSLTITSDGKKLATVPISNLTGSEMNFMTEYVFPQKGIYSLTIQGTIDTKKQVSFKMNYDLRVDREDTPTTSTMTQTNTLSPLTLTALALIALFVFGVLFYSRSRKK